MPTFKVNVYWNYKSADVATVEVEAKDEEEAKRLALEQAEGPDGADLTWDACDISEGDYEAEIIKDE